MFVEPSHSQRNNQTADYVLCWLGTETRRCHFVKSVVLVNLLLLTLWRCTCSLQRRPFFPPLTRACYIDRSRRNHFLTRPNSWSVLTSKMAGDYDSQEYYYRSHCKIRLLFKLARLSYSAFYVTQNTFRIEIISRAN